MAGARSITMAHLIKRPAQHPAARGAVIGFRADNTFIIRLQGHPLVIPGLVPVGLVAVIRVEIVDRLADGPKALFREIAHFMEEIIFALILLQAHATTRCLV